jgi:UDP-N-acetylmuramoyl-L-alanyl-D-glutamate--2,6-diaminopimelate ligase
MKRVRLADLLPGTPLDDRIGNLVIEGVSVCPSSLKPGDLFVDIHGELPREEGLIEMAAAAGASAVITEETNVSLEAPPVIKVSNAWRALSEVASRYYPLQPDVVAAVTGTSGKTSVAGFVRQIWCKLGYRAASIGTVGVVSPFGNTPCRFTTPEPLELHRAIQDLTEMGTSHLVVEASSHGLDQHRLDGLRVGVAAFTNLSHEHLDYHKTIQRYLDAKLRLFTEVLQPTGTAVISADQSHGPEFVQHCRVRKLSVITVGRDGSDIAALSSEPAGFGQEIVVGCFGAKYSTTLPLTGHFQAENALLAAGICIAAGQSPGRVFESLAALQGEPGRFEIVGRLGHAPVIVDYAHKPDALEKILRALRPLAKGRLMVVFGCGGERDFAKRPLMGDIAARLADTVIVTDDNPRGEDPARIRSSILEGVPRAIEIADRRTAIETAVNMLKPGDVLLLAGKGDESGITIGDSVIPFSDRSVALNAIAHREGK